MSNVIKQLLNEKVQELIDVINQIPQSKSELEKINEEYSMDLLNLLRKHHLSLHLVKNMSNAKIFVFEDGVLVVTPTPTYWATTFYDGVDVVVTEGKKIRDDFFAIKQKHNIDDIMAWSEINEMEETNEPTKEEHLPETKGDTQRA